MTAQFHKDQIASQVRDVKAHPDPLSGQPNALAAALTATLLEYQQHLRQNGCQADSRPEPTRWRMLARLERLQQ